MKRQSVGQTNFFYLFNALLFLLFAIPLTHDFEILNPAQVRAFFFSVLMIVGARSLKGGGRFFTVGMVLAAVGVVLNVLAVSQSSLVFQYGSYLSLIAFLLVSISYTLRQVAFGTEINTNRLVGAICVYLLLGVIWALVYSLLEFAAPSSFTGVGLGLSDAAGWDSSWIYFSFVTLTTLGYGDITPVSETARSLVYLQAIAGQFYIAVLVAGLVSAYITDKQSS
jgi:voltage-gated potassium channel